MNLSAQQKFVLSLFLILGALSIFGAGFIAGKTSGLGGENKGLFDTRKFFSNEPQPSFDLLEEGFLVIKKMYVDADNIKEEDLIYGAIEGMVNALDDPYSVFFEPEVSKVFEENINGTFEGIGAEIGVRDEILIIISPLKNSPSEKAGLKAGDKVLFVDKTPTADLTLDEAVQIIRGPKGTTVTLTISREEVEDNIEVSIVRDTIRIPNLLWEKKEGNVAYIQLYHFTESARGDFEELANEVLRSDTDKIMLDLRNNPGGLLEVAVDIAGWFLPPNSVVTSEARGQAGEGKTYRTDGSGSLSGYPIVVLINQGSASASEILAGALRDHRAAKLIGEKTFGKGSVQQLSRLSDGSNIKITVAKWLTPNGVSIDGNGLEPDIKVEMTQDIFDKEGDIQLKRAIEVIKEF